MNADQLKEFLNDMVTFLGALDKVLPPGKVDDDLVAWLQSVKDQPWTCDLLHRALAAKK